MDEFTKLYLDTILDDSADADHHQRLAVALGVTAMKKVVDDLLTQRMTINFSAEMAEKLTKESKDAMLVAQYEAWIAAIRRAHVDECLKCEHLMTCAPFTRLTSSIIIPKDGKPSCAAFEACFNKYWEQTLKEALEAGTKEKTA